MRRNKVKISERALVKRINRWLKKEKDQQLMKLRRDGGRPNKRETELGTYFIVHDDAVVARHVDIESFAREHDVLRSFELVDHE